MHIAVFVDYFPVVSQTFVLRQITGLIDLGHEVDIYAEWPDESGCTHPEVQEYRLLDRTTFVNPTMPAATGYWEMPIWPLTGRTWLPGADRPMWNAARAARAFPAFIRCLASAPRLTLQSLDPGQYGAHASNLSALYRLSLLRAAGRRYDVLHAHFGPVGTAFRFARALWGAPFLVSFHGYDCSRWPREAGPAAYAPLFRVADVVTVNSDFARRTLEGLGCPSEKLYRLRYGVDLDKFPFRERTITPGEPVRLLSVARLVEKKGLEYSIRAVAAVCQRGLRLRYDIVGEGPLRGHIEGLIRQLGLGAVVNLHGARAGSEVRRLMEMAHVFVLCSVTAADGDQEGTPVSLMEAQASGLPVLSTLHSGIPEVVADGCSGFLLPERDVDGAADRLTHLAEHPEAWPELGRRGRRHMEEHYEIQKANRELADLYRRVIHAVATGEKRRTTGFRARLEARTHEDHPA